MRPLARALKGRVTAPVVAGVGVLVLLGTLSAGQVQTWRSSLSMWENCVRVSPDDVLVRRALAENLALCGEPEKALEQSRIAVRLDPGLLEKMDRFAHARRGLCRGRPA